VRIDIWSDIVCPFCYLGQRHLELALAQFDRADEVDIVWRSFELDPGAQPQPQTSLAQTLADKYGMSIEQAEAGQRQLADQFSAVGLTFNWRDAHPANTFDAHRLTHLAAGHGLADAAQTALKKGYFTDGLAIGDHGVLKELAVGIGLPADEVDAVLDSDRFAEEVRADEALASRYGISAVPAFVIDQRYLISGAQPVATLLDALNQIAGQAQPIGPTCSSAGGC